MITKISQNNQIINIEVKQPTLRYIQEFLDLKCRDDLLKTGWYNNAKEITESMAIFNAFRKYIWKYLENLNPLIWVIGDGVYPRTAGLFVFRTPYWVVSIDPQLRIPSYLHTFESIKRLICIKSKIEEIKENNIFKLFDIFILVFCHSHASIVKSVITLKRFCKKFYIISMPCCVPDDLPILPFKSYEDYGVFSIKRTINLYRLT